MASGDFQVNVPSGFSNPDINVLSDFDRSTAGTMGLTEEEFRAAKAGYLAGEARLRSRGNDLGEIIQGFLDELGHGYRLHNVNWNPAGGWILQVQTPEGEQNVALSWFFVDDVLNLRTRTELDRLRNMVLFGLGRRDLIFGNAK